MDKNDKKLRIWMCLAVAFCTIALFFTLQSRFNFADTEKKEIVKLEIVKVETIRCATEKENIEHKKEEVEALAKTVWGEARGLNATGQAAVVWCVLNRVENENFPNDIISVITQKNQFAGYNPLNPVEDEILFLVNDVLNRWYIEDTSIGDVGRVLPKDYLWFMGTGTKNIFRTQYVGGETWDWSLESPYKED